MGDWLPPNLRSIAPLKPADGNDANGKPADGSSIPFALQTALAIRYHVNRIDKPMIVPLTALKQSR